MLFTQRIAIFSNSNRECKNTQCGQSAGISALFFILHNSWTQETKLVRYGTLCNNLLSTYTGHFLS